MISYIIGKLTEKEEGRIVIESNGIGFEVFVSNTSLYTLPELGSNIQINTYMHVKEDGMTLFGFYSKDEKNMFMQLLNVNGVGPKSALAVLSGIKLSELASAILKEDIRTLSKVKGLGTKTAERIILELKGKVNSFGMADAPAELINYNESAVNEATEILISLGINKGEAYKLARNFATENSTAEDIITNALKGMNR